MQRSWWEGGRCKPGGSNPTYLRAGDNRGAWTRQQGRLAGIRVGSAEAHNRGGERGTECTGFEPVFEGRGCWADVKRRSTHGEAGGIKARAAGRAQQAQHGARLAQRAGRGGAAECREVAVHLARPTCYRASSRLQAPSDAAAQVERAGRQDRAHEHACHALPARCAAAGCDLRCRPLP